MSFKLLKLLNESSISVIVDSKHPLDTLFGIITSSILELLLLFFGAIETLPLSDPFPANSKILQTQVIPFSVYSKVSSN